MVSSVVEKIVKRQDCLRMWVELKKDFSLIHNAKKWLIQQKSILTGTKSTE